MDLVCVFIIFFMYTEGKNYILVMKHEVPSHVIVCYALILDTCLFGCIVASGT